MRPFRTPTVLVALALGSGCGDTTGTERVFVTTLGSDTVGAEAFRRSGDRLEGTLVTRAGGTRLAHYVLEVGGSGDARRLTVDWSEPGSLEPITERIVTTVANARATIVRLVGDSTTRTEIDAPDDAIPTLGRTPYSFAIQDVAVPTIGDARAVEITLIPPDATEPVRARLTRERSGTFFWDFFGSPMRVLMGSAGVVGVDGTATTMKVLGFETPDVDVVALAADFVDRDRRGEGLGVLSPRAQVESAIGGATVRIAYGRPAKRGRALWGGLVPYDTVWRTGANAATELSTDRDLRVGDFALPAGSYSLWSRFSRDGGQLILNSGTGQWGTAHDPALDLFSVPMTRELRSTDVERLTFEISEGHAGNGVISLSWGRTRWSVPLSVP